MAGSPAVQPPSTGSTTRLIELANGLASNTTSSAICDVVVWSIRRHQDDLDVVRDAAALRRPRGTLVVVEPGTPLKWFHDSRTR